MHRDVAFELDTLAKIRTIANWLEQHLPDLHELAYGQSSGSDTDHVQTSDERDLSDDLGRPARHAWRNVHKALNAAHLELERAEYSTGEQFTAGRLPDADRPGRDSSLPKDIARQVHRAAARRKARGEWTPIPLGGDT